MNVFKLLRLIVIRYYSNNWFKLIFTCLGISLGWLYLSQRAHTVIHILNYVSEQTQFKSFTNLTIKSRTGNISFDQYNQLTQSPLIKHLVAKIEKTGKVLNHQTSKYEAIRIIGIDMINIPADGPITTDLNDIESLFSPRTEQWPII